MPHVGHPLRAAAMPDAEQSRSIWASRRSRRAIPRQMAGGDASVDRGLQVRTHLLTTRLRRAAVDAFLRAGVDVGTAAAFFGHSPQVMLEHYRRANIDDHRKAALATRLGALMDGDVIPFPSRRATG